MKPLIFFVALLIATTTYSTPFRVDEKIEKRFRDAFPKAEDVHWYENKTDYEVVFYHQNILCRIRYALDGEVESATRYYKEEGLPLFVTARIKRKFDGMKIYGVTEITTTSDLRYYIILETENKWILVDADAFGNSMITKKFNKNR
ncbi:MAG: hypothetical protein ICV65_07670 [Flavisolibacter sp.]|nr:hypothetical protein [Flavisolibacter sp.]